MPVNEVLQRLETRAVTAEKIIGILKKEIEDVKDLKRGVQNHGNENKVLEMQKENEQLRKEIEALKYRLMQLELSQGVEQISIPASKSTGTTQEEIKPVSTPQDSSNTNGSHSEENNAPKNQKASKVKKEKPSAQVPNKPKGRDAQTTEDPPVDVGRLDLRVGQIVSVKKHPDADSLYVEEVNVGEERPRTVVSGLVKFVPIEEMQNRMVVLLCNLKPAKMRGITSEAMVMCASTPEKVEILVPPQGSVPGDLIYVDGYERTPDVLLNPKKKIFETVAPDLKTNDSKIATYNGSPFSVCGKGFVTAPTLVRVNIK